MLKRRGDSVQLFRTLQMRCYRHNLYSPININRNLLLKKEMNLRNRVPLLPNSQFLQGYHGQWYQKIKEHEDGPSLSWLSQRLFPSITSTVSILYPRLKLNWNSCRKFISSRSLCNCCLTIFSTTFPIKGRLATTWSSKGYWSRWCTIASFKARGITLFLKDHLSCHLKKLWWLVLTYPQFRGSCPVSRVTNSVLITS